MHTMARKVDLSALRKRATQEVREAMTLYDSAGAFDYWYQAWIAKMTAVEVHAIWERYVETRLVAALNHNPKHFIEQQGIAGLTRISTGLARYIVRGGRPYFDFRSIEDLLGKANHWLGSAANPFNALSPPNRAYIDCLAAIRNCVVHGSDASINAYKRRVRTVYGVVAVPETQEFIHAKDYRPTSPARNKSRLHGLAEVVVKAIQTT
jgi:hypothetical protein